MTYIYKEELMIEIFNRLKQTTKDFPNHIDDDLIHIDLGELSSYETIFNMISVKGPISDEALDIEKSFKKELDAAHKILENNLEIVLKRMII